MNRETLVNIHPAAFGRLATTFDDMRQRALAAWYGLPASWRSDRALLAVAAVTAFALLAAFHQVVHAGVERAAERDAAAYRRQALAALCSVEKDVQARALCELTRPGTRSTQVAAVN